MQIGPIGFPKKYFLIEELPADCDFVANKLLKKTYHSMKTDQSARLFD